MAEEKQKHKEKEKEKQKHFEEQSEAKLGIGDVTAKREPDRPSRRGLRLSRERQSGGLKPIG